MARLRAQDPVSAHQARPLIEAARVICEPLEGGPVCEAVDAWLAAPRP
ncbi:MAG: hypothetical protein K0V04_12910 [Deltaproteobacteria bacterium]|nr:hypothetical protein [Deltaproteobacteria bacterium]